MGAQELFRDSSAWDRKWDLPLVPAHNNPWIYGAYAYQLMKLNGILDFERRDLEFRFYKYFSLCTVRQGLINRFPDGRGGQTSHDELMGAASINPLMAREIYFYLKISKGYYINRPDELKGRKQFFRHNIRRFPWAVCYIKLAGGINPSLFQTFYTYGHILLNAYSGSEGGSLRVWLMREHLSKNKILKHAYKKWEKIKEKRGDANPAAWFMGELPNEKVFIELSPEKL